MKRQQYLFVGIVIVVAALLGGLFALYPAQVVAIISGVAGWVLLVLNWAYKHWDKLYLLVQRIKAFFAPDTTWFMTVRYQVQNADVSLLRDVERLLCDRYPNEAKKIYKLSSNILDLTMGPMHAQIMVNGEDDVEVHILDMQVTLQKTEDVLAKVIGPILDCIESVFKPERKRYFFTVQFDGKRNPYFGLYLQRLANVEVLNFDVTFNVENGQIELHQDQLTIKANSFGELFQLSRKYVLLGISG
jgi:hypothetical protein